MDDETPGVEAPQPDIYRCKTCCAEFTLQGQEAFAAEAQAAWLCGRHQAENCRSVAAGVAALNEMSG